MDSGVLNKPLTFPGLYFCAENKGKFQTRQTSQIFNFHRYFDIFWVCFKLENQRESYGYFVKRMLSSGSYISSLDSKPYSNESLIALFLFNDFLNAEI